MMYEKPSYYHTCPYCGANLDPGESCDCQKDNDSNSPDVTEKCDQLHAQKENKKQ